MDRSLKMSRSSIDVCIYIYYYGVDCLFCYLGMCFYLLALEKPLLTGFTGIAARGFCDVDKYNYFILSISITSCCDLFLKIDVG